MAGSHTYDGSDVDNLAGGQGDGCQIGSLIEGGALAPTQALIAWYNSHLGGDQAAPYENSQAQFWT